MCEIDDICRYIVSGKHAFVGCDSSVRRDDLARKLALDLSDRPYQVIDASNCQSGQQFAVAFADACNALVGAIDTSLPPRRFSLSGMLAEVMQQFSQAERQGFLFINHIDSLIQSQHTFEIEGALRSVMQLHDDVTVVLCGSNEIIDLIGQSDRPFYLSFRIFRL